MTDRPALDALLAAADELLAEAEPAPVLPPMQVHRPPRRSWAAAGVFSRA